LAFRAGALNIGAEGQILAGAAAGVAVGLRLGASPPIVAIPATLAAGCAGGAAAAGIAAALRRWRRVPEVLSTILLNFVLLEVVSWLVRGPLQEAGRAYPQSDPIAAAAMLPRLLPPSRLHAGFLVALAAAAAMTIFLFRTAAGFRVRAVGLGPRASALAGFRPERVVALALVASGALAGLAGSVEVAGLTGRLYGDLSGGTGYVAIAVALLARLHPLGAIAAAIGFGALESGAAHMQRVAGVSAALAHAIEALALAAVLAADHLAQRRVPVQEEPAAAVAGAATP
ncbi:MAG TPA: ABC transporter permease, partial [Planctomycetota bacterium]|nr:ABC transporter permease [Planctomycetota bacterium]